MNAQQLVADLQDVVTRHQAHSVVSGADQQVGPTEAGKLIELCIAAGESFMLHGNPGVSKSQRTCQIADRIFAPRYGYSVDPDTLEVSDTAGNLVLKVKDRPWIKDIRVALLEGPEISGLPYLADVAGSTEKRTRYSIPDIIAELDPRGGLLFFDEINRGQTGAINAAFSLATTGEVGGYSMPRGWTCGSAINDKDVGTIKLPGALDRRFTHISMAASLIDTLNYGASQEWDPMVLAFLSSFPELLDEFDPKSAERVSPNPRSWESVSRLHKEAAATGLQEHLLNIAITGKVGRAASITFQGFRALFGQLPDINEVFMSPKSAPVPTSPAARYAIVAALIKRVTRVTFSNAVTYLLRSEFSPEYGMLAIKSIIGRDRSYVTHPGYVKWTTTHAM